MQASKGIAAFSAALITQPFLWIGCHGLMANRARSLS
jgi:hypothetical protein